MEKMEGGRWRIAKRKLVAVVVLPQSRRRAAASGGGTIREPGAGHTSRACSRRQPQSQRDCGNHAVNRVSQASKPKLVGHDADHTQRPGVLQAVRRLVELLERKFGVLVELLVIHQLAYRAIRSEERRVGKESRCQ